VRPFTQPISRFAGRNRAVVSGWIHAFLEAHPLAAVHGAGTARRRCPGRKAPKCSGVSSLFMATDHRTSRSPSIHAARAGDAGGTIRHYRIYLRRHYSRPRTLSIAHKEGATANVGLVAGDHSRGSDSDRKGVRASQGSRPAGTVAAHKLSLRRPARHARPGVAPPRRPQTG
jgi:hypothetical protein